MLDVVNFVYPRCGQEPGPVSPARFARFVYRERHRDVEDRRKRVRAALLWSDMVAWQSHLVGSEAAALREIAFEKLDHDRPRCSRAFLRHALWLTAVEYFKAQVSRLTGFVFREVSLPAQIFHEKHTLDERWVRVETALLLPEIGEWAESLVGGASTELYEKTLEQFDFQALYCTTAFLRKALWLGAAKHFWGNRVPVHVPLSAVDDRGRQDKGLQSLDDAEEEQRLTLTLHRVEQLKTRVLTSQRLECREAFELYQKGMSQADIAKRQGTAKSTAGRRLRDVLKAFRHELNRRGLSDEAKLIQVNEEKYLRRKRTLKAGQLAEDANEQKES